MENKMYSFIFASSENLTSPEADFEKSKFWLKNALFTNYSKS